jgi:Vacuolar protein sorting-associated protein 26
MFSFISGPKIGIKFRDSETRPKKSVKVPGQAHLEEMVLFAGSDTVAGTVDISLPSGRALEHMGIKVEMIGQVGE